MRAKLLFGSARALLVREEVVQDDVELLAGPADAGTTFCLTRCSASSVRLQVENAEIFQSAGDVRAIRQMCSRTWLLIILGQPAAQRTEDQSPTKASEPSH
ncbi:hypothetical protein [Nonomuraea sp. NPDC049504]|uniref:hypothetical protein n=1 Tax=Nonomuraea sp. NPDC049504 TaxID=3154729 RepID=UPI003414892E